MSLSSSSFLFVPEPSASFDSLVQRRKDGVGEFDALIEKVELCWWWRLDGCSTLRTDPFER